MAIKREYPEAPLIGVGAIIVENGRVVLIKRGHPPLLGEWSIPGGVLEVGEMLREAAVREAQEETGLRVEPGEILGVYDRILREGNRLHYHYVLIDFLCRRVSGEIRRGSDADEVRWFKGSEIEALNLAPETAEVVRKGLDSANTASFKAPADREGSGG
jgi:8-oxo-dGTP diphosphatase